MRVVILAMLAMTGPAAADTIQLFAAGSLKAALTDVATAYEAAGGAASRGAGVTRTRGLRRRGRERPPPSPGRRSRGTTTRFRGRTTGGAASRGGAAGAGVATGTARGAGTAGAPGASSGQATTSASTEGTASASATLPQRTRSRSPRSMAPIADGRGGSPPRC